MTISQRDSKMTTTYFKWFVAQKVDRYTVLYIARLSKPNLEHFYTIIFWVRKALTLKPL